MMKKICYLLLMISAGLFSGCNSDESSSVDPAVPFYQSLRAEYDMTRNKTHVSANFNKKNSLGENITLVGEASVLFNGHKADYLNLGPYFYTYTFSELVGVTFKFTREKGKVYENTASQGNVNPIAIPAAFTTVTINEPTSLVWEGGAVGSDESVQITIESAAIGSNNFYIEAIGATSGSIKLAGTPEPGQATLSLSRIKTFPLQQSDGKAGGNIVVVYTVNKEITIK